MAWRMQVKSKAHGWQDVSPTATGRPYEYDTRDEAEYVLRISYPDQVREQRLGGEEVVRVVEVPSEVP